MSETLRATFRRMLRLENRREAIRPGRIERIRDFRSAILGNAREVTIYLPAGYDEHPDSRYPVLYMQDGQNLFDAERAYIPGQHWRLADAADAAIGERTVTPLIIAGVDHAGVGRLDEYTPSRDRRHRGGGRAEEYGRMLIEELKPEIDSRFRTRAGPESTGIGGSSLGGLVALYLALTRPGNFRRVMAMSPSVWWDDRFILRELDDYEGPPPMLWADTGGREGLDALKNARALRDHARARGWNDETFRYHEERRADHSERSWARRVRMPLEFLFPPM